MKKRLSLLLALLLLAGAAAGCSESNPETPASEAGQTGAAVPSAEAEEVPVETEYVEPFEAEVTDQGGRTVNIFMAGNWAFDDFEAEEMTGEALNDAKYQTNSAVQDAFNVVLTTENISGQASGGQGAGYKAITNVNMSGTADYAFADVGCYDVSTLAYQGHILDLNQV